MTSENQKVTRVKFLRSLGLSVGAAFAATYCLSSCENEAETAVTPVTTGTVIDLADAQYAKLNTMGNYVIVNNIVIAHTSEGKFVAVPLTCSHEGQKQVMYRTNEFYCTAHGARFDNQGKGLNSNGSKGLQLYKVTQSGTKLTIS